MQKKNKQKKKKHNATEGRGLRPMEYRRRNLFFPTTICPSCPRPPISMLSWFGFVFSFLFLAAVASTLKLGERGGMIVGKNKVRLPLVRCCSIVDLQKRLVTTLFEYRRTAKTGEV